MGLRLGSVDQAQVYDTHILYSASSRRAAFPMQLYFTGIQQLTILIAKSQGNIMHILLYFPFPSSRAADRDEAKKSHKVDRQGSIKIKATLELHTNRGLD